MLALTNLHAPQTSAVMYSTSHPVSSTMNGMGSGMIDGSGTINPAALNTTVSSVLPSPNSRGQPNASPRGQKRSRSPDSYGGGDLSNGGQLDDDGQPTRKRGRPPKPRLSGGSLDDPSIQIPQQTQQPVPPKPQTPQIQNQGLSPQANATPTQNSPPPRTTPSKAVVKALPTVRDHTTDQLNPEGDEYIPRETDEAGEKKVSPNGRALEGREYKCRTFLVPNRGDKLFMLATECARVLGYRDSYLLFNKNRSLFKIIATQPEKDDLIQQEILPYSYRSRQIAIVTAKSMFRQFGSRVIVNGRRVRDDYWESKARKQGFTEEDLAGEKRPGGAKAAREAQAAEAATASAMGHHQDIVYSSGPGTVPVNAHGHPQLMQGMGGAMGGSLAPLPMINLAPSEDMRLRDYGNIPRPRQEITGTPYQDRIQPSSATEIMTQATHTAEFSKALNEQQKQRVKALDQYWKQPRDVPVSTPMLPGAETSSTALPQTLQQSPQLTSAGMMSSNQQAMIQHHNTQVMTPHTYQPQAHQQQPSASQSPGRNVQQHMRPDQMQHRSGSISYGSGAAGVPQSSAYGYPGSSQIWGQPPPQPQQSPLAAHHGISHYSPQSHHQPHPSHSPHPAQLSQQHGSQPQLHHSQSSGSIHGGAIGYHGIPNMTPGYGGMGGGRSMYQQSSQAYVQAQTTAGTAANLQGWAPPSQQSHGGQQSWQGYQ